MTREPAQRRLTPSGETLLRLKVFGWKLLGLTLLGLGGLSGGCGTAQAEPQIEVQLADLPDSQGVTAAGSWQSSAFQGDGWVSYPSSTVLVIHHALGRVPTAVLPYVAFVPDGGGASLASGDLARIVSVDEATVTIQNATDTELFLRLVLE